MLHSIEQWSEKKLSRWLESWGLLLATDVSTTYVEAIFRVKINDK